MSTTNFISLQQAIEMTTTYRDNREKVLAPEYQGKNILPICETFDRDAFDKVLSQGGCVKMRIYLGMDDNKQIKAIIVGVDGQDRDMLPPASAAAETDNGSIIDNGTRCPYLCPPPSALNS